MPDESVLIELVELLQKSGVPLITSDLLYYLCNCILSLSNSFLSFSAYKN